MTLAGLWCLIRGHDWFYASPRDRRVCGRCYAYQGREDQTTGTEPSE